MATGTSAVAVLRCTFGIINWRNKIDRKTRKILTMYKMNHPKANIDTQYLNWSDILVHRRDNQHCRTSEHKIQKSVCKHC